MTRLTISYPTFLSVDVYTILMSLKTDDDTKRAITTAMAHVECRDDEVGDYCQFTVECSEAVIHGIIVAMLASKFSYALTPQHYSPSELDALRHIGQIAFSIQLPSKERIQKSMANKATAAVYFDIAECVSARGPAPLLH